MPPAGQAKETQPGRLLSNVTVVLVEPQEPGNVGAAARAMNNMGITRLALVRPRPYLVPHAYRMALGGADLLERAEVFDDVGRSVAGAAFVVGTTRRNRSVKRAVFSPRPLAAEFVRHARGTTCAILFGREDRGLTNDELELCHRLVTIPTCGPSASLNLAQAVLVMAYETHLAAAELSGSGDSERARKLAPSGELEGMFDHMEKVLTDIGYLDEQNPKRMMRVFRDIIFRAGLDAREVSALRGIFRQLTWHANAVGSQGTDPGETADF